MEQMVDVPALQVKGKSFLAAWTNDFIMRYDTYHSSVSHAQGKSNFKNSCSKDTIKESSKTEKRNAKNK
jgi:hypothetical protein